MGQKITRSLIKAGINLLFFYYAPTKIAKKAAFFIDKLLIWSNLLFGGEKLDKEALFRLVYKSPAVISLKRNLETEKETQGEKLKIVKVFLEIIKDTCEDYVALKDLQERKGEIVIAFTVPIYKLRWHIQSKTLVVADVAKDVLLKDNKLNEDNILGYLDHLRAMVNQPLEHFYYLKS